MDHATHLWLFFGLVFGIVILPGMDMAFVLGSALAGGFRAGLAAVAGLIAGGFCHVAIAATGLATVLTVLPAAFNALLVAGSAYVAYLGFELLRSTAGFNLDKSAPSLTRLATFRRAAFTNLMNPKAYVFMLAVFPQFVRPHAAIAPQALELGAIISVTQGLVYGGIAWLAGGVRLWLDTNPRASRGFSRAVGVMLILVAVVTVVEGWRGKG
jgi:threonine/homoserine/homoserine lactone efflux protein